MDRSASAQDDDRQAFKADLEKGCRTLGDFLRSRFGGRAGNVLRLMIKAEAGYASPTADGWLGQALEDPDGRMDVAVPDSLILELGPYLESLGPEDLEALAEASIGLKMALIQWTKFTRRDLDDWTREVIYEVGERIVREYDTA